MARAPAPYRLHTRERSEEEDRAGLLPWPEGVTVQERALQRIDHAELGSAVLVAKLLVMIREALAAGELEARAKPLTDWTDWDIIDFAKRQAIMPWHQPGPR